MSGTGGSGFQAGGIPGGEPGALGAGTGTGPDEGKALDEGSGPGGIRSRSPGAGGRSDSGEPSDGIAVRTPSRSGGAESQALRTIVPGSSNIGRYRTATPGAGTATGRDEGGGDGTATGREDGGSDDDDETGRVVVVATTVVVRTRATPGGATNAWGASGAAWTCASQPQGDPGTAGGPAGIPTGFEVM